MIKISLVGLYIGGEIVSLVRETGPVAQAVLVVLLVFSILSWSIILSKWASLRRARTQSARFLRAFRKAQRLQDVAAVAEQFNPSPLVPVFDNGYNELRRQGPQNMTAVQRATQIASSEELTRLERRLPWLATTGSVTPFIGFFGTRVGSYERLNRPRKPPRGALPPGAPPSSDATSATVPAH